MKDKSGEYVFPPLGKTPREDTAAVMKFYNLPKAFPRAVLEEARALPREVIADGRLDLRKKYIFTCDPVTARDYDDALSCETDRRGNSILGVHIADVSRYVTPGSAIDREACKRSTSVYLADRVVPMLPEELSNGLCSLVPGEDRYAFSVFMTFDKTGEMIARSFAKSVIRSRRRFTYEQVMTLLEGGNVPGVASRERRTVTAISSLARQLRDKRFAAGALDLDIPEADVQLDAAGEMTGIVLRPNDASHQMIEECMVAANEAVAKELWTKGIKILARLHETPDPEKILLLRTELRGAGVKAGDISKPKVFSRLLTTIRRHPLYPTLAMMVLRSMKRACYDSTTIGHFGLAKKYYAHFTSPIRRYPDLTLHRQLADYLAGHKAQVPPRTLAAWAEHASAAEERAAEAERALLEMKKFRLLDDQIAHRQIVEYPAVVSKCLPFGCFVEIPDLAVSGLVHVSALSRRFVRYNESDGTLSAPGGGSWRPGDTLRVHVAKVDFKQHRIDFVPVREQNKRKGQKWNSQH